MMLVAQSEASRFVAPNEDDCCDDITVIAVWL